MKLYKLTDEHGQTKNNTQWGENITHTAKGNGQQGLCSDGWIHAYEHPLLAVLLNPIHGAFIEPRLWEAEGEIGESDHQLKCGCRSLTTIKEIPLPVITAEQKVKFAILCALAVYKDKGFKAWADSWISGEDRSYKSAAAAHANAAASNAAASNAAAYANASYAAYAYADAAVNAAYAAVNAAYAAADAAYAADANADAAAYAAADAAYAAYANADAAVNAAHAAAIDLIAIAIQATS